MTDPPSATWQRYQMRTHCNHTTSLTKKMMQVKYLTSSHYKIVQLHHWTPVLPPQSSPRPSENKSALWMFWMSPYVSIWRSQELLRKERKSKMMWIYSFRKWQQQLESSLHVHWPTSSSKYVWRLEYYILDNNTE